MTTQNSMARQPVVGIVMGSDSDLAVMELTAKALERKFSAMLEGKQDR